MRCKHAQNVTRNPVNNQRRVACPKISKISNGLGFRPAFTHVSTSAYHDVDVVGQIAGSIHTGVNCRHKCAVFCCFDGWNPEIYRTIIATRKQQFMFQKDQPLVTGGAGRHFMNLAIHHHRCNFGFQEMAFGSGFGNISGNPEMIGAFVQQLVSVDRDGSRLNSGCCKKVVGCQPGISGCKIHFQVGNICQIAGTIQRKANAGKCQRFFKSISHHIYCNKPFIIFTFSCRHICGDYRTS